MVVAPVLQQLMNQDQNLVPDRHQRLLLAHPLHPSAVRRLENGPLGVTGGPRHLDQHRSQPLAPLGRLATASLASALIVARAKARP